MSDDPFGNPEDTREQILAATYRTLRDRGYAELTISAIGETFEKSPSLVYRHYDSKDELVLDCLTYMLDRYERQLTEDEITDPKERLEAFVEWGFEDAPPEREAFLSAIIELRSRAPHDESYESHFTRSDDVFVGYLADVIRSGIERGTFRECDPEQAAQLLVTTLSGTLFRRSTTDSSGWLDDVHEELQTYLETRLYRD
ncbi:TetR/AcrR family transcriptional regulator [Halopiger goleimassiliensis]|uniref:TetR/AcrR family transcriptional regulator n=1 Tax=Halopiger goleimassiliensis TaxID=1293048 RepID=UPI000678320F|nr:TetR/AcrR family transcriptional regulator [Halopiger goleimassiliensis]